MNAMIFSNNNEGCEAAELYSQGSCVEDSASGTNDSLYFAPFSK